MWRAWVSLGRGRPETKNQIFKQKAHQPHYKAPQNASGFLMIAMLLPSYGLVVSAAGERGHGAERGRESGRGERREGPVGGSAGGARARAVPRAGRGAR